MHWTDLRTKKSFEPDTLDKFGFVYIITNIKNKKCYIGCKQYYIGRDQDPSRWETYTGSSKHLNADIKKVGKKHFTFEVIDEFNNKRSLRYYECFYQMKWDVLTATMKDSDDPAFYNSYVGGKFYRPIQGYQMVKVIKKIISKKMLTGEKELIIAAMKREDMVDEKR